ncbi:helix-turn-helix transcriptional regulator [Paenibacillus massiliensis]|uniref:helix-turn-helix transcriptional regulator n=1 Tax=Paenibacillus massiliensis TaxID=225917 RepID=UPI000471BF90|nr:AraC family transcriptional regulator [Paenibacillus massiliensis]
MHTDYLFEIEQVRRTEQFDMMTDHFHDSYEIYYLLDGERYYYIHNRLYALQAGDLIVITKNELHRTTNKGPAGHERILINFDDRFIRKALDIHQDSQPLLPNQNFLLRPDSREQEAIREMMSAMLREQVQELSFKLLCQQSLLVQLLILIRRIQAAGHSPIIPERSEKQERVYEIIEHLNQEYTRRLTLEDIADVFYISSPYLCRIFKETTGFTVIEYLNYVRIRQAQELLRETSWRVTRIAESTGFDSIAHFGRVFKQMTNRTPLQYRKQYQI